MTPQSRIPFLIGECIMDSAYIGIDLAIAKDKVLPVVIGTWKDGRFVPKPLRGLDMTPPRGMGNAATLGQQTIATFVREARVYIAAACERLRLVPARIAIDAPSAPRRADQARRRAEVALDRAGISCFTTPSMEEFATIRAKVAQHLASGGREDRIPHSNQLWMLVGFALFTELSQLAPCLEVFPQAIARALGAADLHKSQPGAVASQLNAAARFTGWPTQHDDPPLSTIAWGASHDQLDAYLTAWVAGLDEEQRTALGDPPHDVIWVPTVPTQAPLIWPARTIRSGAPARPARVIAHESGMLCPACGDKRFQRWPWGWDAHAAHACRGLAETEPERRKAEFKRRFGSYFR